MTTLASSYVYLVTAKQVYLQITFEKHFSLRVKKLPTICQLFANICNEARDYAICVTERMQVVKQLRH